MATNQAAQTPARTHVPWPIWVILGVELLFVTTGLVGILVAPEGAVDPLNYVTTAFSGLTVVGVLTRLASVQAFLVAYWLLGALASLVFGFMYLAMRDARFAFDIILYFVNVGLLVWFIFLLERDDAHAWFARGRQDLDGM